MNQLEYEARRQMKKQQKMIQKNLQATRKPVGNKRTQAILQKVNQSIHDGNKRKRDLPAQVDENNSNTSNVVHAKNALPLLKRATPSTSIYPRTTAGAGHTTIKMNMHMTQHHDHHPYLNKKKTTLSTDESDFFSFSPSKAKKYGSMRYTSSSSSDEKHLSAAVLPEEPSLESNPVLVSPTNEVPTNKTDVLTSIPPLSPAQVEMELENSEYLFDSDSNEDLPATAAPVTVTKSALGTVEPSNLKNQMHQMCFSTEELVTSLSMTKDGRYIIVTFSSGAIRLFHAVEGKNVQEDRYGYLLGHLDENQNQQMNAGYLKLVITEDGQYCFIGVRAGPRVMCCIALNGFEEKASSSSEVKKYFHTDGKLRGFADAIQNSTNGDASSRKVYRLLCGLGVGNLRLWEFHEPQEDHDVIQAPEWNCVHCFNSGGNTAYFAAFLSSNVFVSRANEKEIRYWITRSSSSDGQKDADNKSTTTTVDTVEKFSIKGSKRISQVIGNYGYATEDDIESGLFWRMHFPLLNEIPTNPDSGFVKEYFTLEGHEGMDSSNTTRGKMETQVDVVAALKDGSRVLGVTKGGGVFYYHQVSPLTDDEPRGMMKMNFIQNIPHFKSPMNHMMPVAICPLGEQDELYQGQVRILLAPNEASTEEGYIMSYSQDSLLQSKQERQDCEKNPCWNCFQTHCQAHWKKPSDPPAAASGSNKSESKPKAITSKSSAIVIVDDDDDDDSSSSSEAEAEDWKTNNQNRKAPSSLMKEHLPQKGRSTKPQIPKPASFSATSEQPQLSAKEIANLQRELEGTKKRLKQITKEADRRLRSELDLRRRWKREETQLQSDLAKAQALTENALADVKTLVLRNTKLKLFVDQHQEANDIRQQYDELQVELKTKSHELAVLQSGGFPHQKHQALIEINMTLAKALVRNGTLMEHLELQTSKEPSQNSQCVICQEEPATHAIYPCGHVCLCAEDADVYQHEDVGRLMEKNCPCCHGEILSIFQVKYPPP